MSKCNMVHFEMENEFCSINLNKLTATYIPGETVQGTLDYEFQTHERVKCIYILFQGECRTQMEGNSVVKYSDHSKVDIFDLSVSNTKEEYFHYTLYVLGTGNVEEKATTIPIGPLSFPFEYTLPLNIPASYKGRIGSIQYNIYAVMKRPWKEDAVCRERFKVFVPFEFTEEKHRAPISLDIHGITAVLCCHFKHFKLRVRVSKSHFYVGQSIPVHLHCINQTRVKVKMLKILLIQKETYYSQADLEPKKWRSRIAVVETGPIKAHGGRDWKEMVNVPPVQTANLDNCSVMGLDYELRVVCVMPMFFFDSGVREQIFIGKSN